MALFPWIAATVGALALSACANNDETAAAPSGADASATAVNPEPMTPPVAPGAPIPETPPTLPEEPGGQIDDDAMPPGPVNPPEP